MCNTYDITIDTCINTKEEYVHKIIGLLENPKNYKAFKLLLKRLQNNN